MSEEGAVSAEHVSVWDVPTRFFHWALVGLILTSWVAIDQGLMRLHLWSGLALLTLLLFRLTWGIIGSTTARFCDFVKPPRTVLDYMCALASAKKLHYPGHNPAGGWMVVIMLATLCAQVATGLFANDGVRFHGPLALHVNSGTSDYLTILHRLLFVILLLCIYVHVVAVFFYLLVKGDNLITPMITGKKLRDQVPEGLEPRFVRTILALILFVAAGVVTWLISRA